MTTITLFHTNDVHGRTIGLAQIATLLDEVRASNAPGAVVYLDAGDVEDTTNRLSNLTKGVQIHHLLNAMGCAAFTVGNAALLRYTERILPEQAAVANYPLLIANLTHQDGASLAGVRPSVMLEAAGAKIGVVGCTAPFAQEQIYEKLFGLRVLDSIEVVGREAAKLREQDAQIVVFLSHLGYDDDKRIAAALQGEIQLIIGGHTHTLIENGEWVGDVLIAQARHYAQYYGKVELEFDGERVTVIGARTFSIAETTPPKAEIVALEATLLEQVESDLRGQVIGTLLEALTVSDDGESTAADLMADVLRERGNADVGLVLAGNSIVKPLAAGPLDALTLYEACWTPASLAITEMTGEQLATFITRGQDAIRATECPHPLRGQAVGLLHISGAQYHAGAIFIDGIPIDPIRRYRVASTDWEVDNEVGLVDASWALEIAYDVSAMLREFVQEYMVRHTPLRVAGGRL